MKVGRKKERKREEGKKYSNLKKNIKWDGKRRKGT